MNNYEYIIAGLPALSPDWKFGESTPQGYIDGIMELCSEKDRKLIGFLLEGLDGEHLDKTFYDAALTHKNEFIREYFSFDLNLRNAKVRFLNRALGRPADKDVLEAGQEGFAEAEAAEAVFGLTDILARERGMDNLMWDKIDSLTTFNYFDINAILGFIAKMSIAARWYKLDEQTGREMFKKLVDEVRSTFKGVEYEI